VKWTVIELFSKDVTAIMLPKYYFIGYYELDKFKLFLVIKIMYLNIGWF